MKRICVFTAIIAAVTLGTQVAQTSAPSVVVIDLGTLGGTGSTAYAINAGGQVVGQSTLAPNAVGVIATHAFSWTAKGGMIDLGSLSAPVNGSEFHSVAQAVNDAGQVVGFSYVFASPNQHDIHAFSWTAKDGMIDLGTLGGTYSNAFGVNATGQVVGVSYIEDSMRAFIWTAESGMMDLGTLGGTLASASAINDRGQVVGCSTTAGDADTHAFLWTAERGMIDLGMTSGCGTQMWFGPLVNARGQVVVDGFFWTATHGVRGLGTLGGNWTDARAVNAGGHVTGSSHLPGNTDQHAFFWTAKDGMIDLGTLAGRDSHGWAINDKDRVVGSSYTVYPDQAPHAFSWTPRRA